MPFRDFGRLTPGRALSARAENRKAGAIAEKDRDALGLAGSSLSKKLGPNSLTYEHAIRQRLAIQILDADGQGNYSFQEVVETEPPTTTQPFTGADGKVIEIQVLSGPRQYIPSGEGFSGTFATFPAIEVNGVTSVPVGAIIPAAWVASAGDCVEFEYPAGSGPGSSSPYLYLPGTPPGSPDGKPTGAGIGLAGGGGTEVGVVFAVAEAAAAAAVGALVYATAAAQAGAFAAALAVAFAAASAQANAGASATAIAAAAAGAAAASVAGAVAAASAAAGAAAAVSAAAGASAAAQAAAAAAAAGLPGGPGSTIVIVYLAIIVSVTNLAASVSLAFTQNGGVSGDGALIVNGLLLWIWNTLGAVQWVQGGLGFGQWGQGGYFSLPYTTSPGTPAKPPTGPGQLVCAPGELFQSSSTGGGTTWDPPFIPTSIPTNNPTQPTTPGPLPFLPPLSPPPGGGPIPLQLPLVGFVPGQQLNQPLVGAGGGIYLGIGPSGQLILGTPLEDPPPSTDYEDGQLGLSYDPTAGAPALDLTGLDSAGNPVSFSLSLTGGGGGITGTFSANHLVMTNVANTSIKDSPVTDDGTTTKVGARKLEVTNSGASVTLTFDNSNATTGTVLDSGGTGVILGSATDVVGFFGGASGVGVSKPTVTGSKGGNAALLSLLTALSDLGLIKDSTT